MARKILMVRELEGETKASRNLCAICIPFYCFCSSFCLLIQGTVTDITLISAA